MPKVVRDNKWISAIIITALLGVIGSLSLGWKNHIELETNSCKAASGENLRSIVDLEAKAAFVAKQRDDDREYVDKRFDRLEKRMNSNTEMILKAIEQYGKN